MSVLAMYVLAALQVLSVVVALCAGAAAALGQTAPAALQSCLAQTGDYVTRGTTVVYVIGITNTCAKRLRCEIYANVSGVRTSSLGHTVMTLGASGSGAAAKQTYSMRVKSAAASPKSRASASCCELRQIRKTPGCQEP